MASTAVGVDIGTRTVTVAEVKSSGSQTQVTNFGGAELAPGIVREGEILDTAAVAASLKELLAAAKVRSKKVWLGVANQRVVVRQIDLPFMPEAELRASLRYQVQEHIPIPVEEAELDVHVVEEFVSEDGQRHQRVLLVAGHQDMVASHVEAARQAGLKPVGVDLNPFAVLRVMGETSPVMEGSQVLVDIGGGVTNVIVHERGVPTFVRILVMGGDLITEALAAGLNVPREEAEARKRSMYLGLGDDVADRIVAEQANSFVNEIRSSLDYYQAQTGASRLSGVVLTGGSALLGGLADRIAEVLRLPVEVGNPFRRYPPTGTVYGPEELAQVGPPLVTSIGLALGGLE